MLHCTNYTCHYNELTQFTITTQYNCYSTRAIVTRAIIIKIGADHIRSIAWWVELSLEWSQTATFCLLHYGQKLYPLGHQALEEI